MSLLKGILFGTGFNLWFPCTSACFQFCLHFNEIGFASDLCLIFRVYCPPAILVHWRILSVSCAVFLFFCFTLVVRWLVFGCFLCFLSSLLLSIIYHQIDRFSVTFVTVLKKILEKALVKVCESVYSLTA